MPFTSESLQEQIALSLMEQPVTGSASAPDSPSTHEETLSHLTWASSILSSSFAATEHNAKMIEPIPETATIGQSAAFPTRKKPLRLLDLPVDILKDIVKEINQTNDLTSLALTHSALHALVIPQMYSRFDIIWPDLGDDAEPRVGVDALAYGLSTLVRSGDPFSYEGPSNQRDAASSCQTQYHRTRRRRGDNYAQYTRKFSLGNGPSSLLDPYLISTESGKMLGTLVALALARMKNLETFVWDMPTGILREVWEALSSLGYRTDGEPARLASIWVRLQDSKEVRAPSNYIRPLPPLQMMAADSGNNVTLSDPTIGNLQAASANLKLLRQSYQQIEHPNFSILPPLKSISVLDIDQIAYLEELSVLVERSVDILRELRLGTSRTFDPEHALTSGPYGDPQKESGLTFLGAGGVLGVIMSKFHDCRRIRPRLQNEKAAENSLSSDNHERDTDLDSPTLPSVESLLAEEVSDSNFDGKDPLVPLKEPLSPVLGISALNVIDDPVAKTRPEAPPSFLSFWSKPDLRPADTKVAEERPVKSVSSLPSVLPSSRIKSNSTATSAIPETTKLSPKRVPVKRKLKLQVLELERISLCVPVLQKTIEWRFLTDLTLLNCKGDAEFWSSLSKSHPPGPKGAHSYGVPNYSLNLKRIHTNGVSSALISFLRDNLAPNTLECLFLQDRAGSKPSKKVTIESIYRGPLRRHRLSLRKVSIDSALKHHASEPSHWKRWMLNREAMAFVMSGKMPKLRELAVSVEYADWHYFLHHLPKVPHLRSLYIPHVNEHVYASRLNAHEMALQILDIVILRPDVELCYIGILNKCFEILECTSYQSGSHVGAHQLLANPILQPGLHWAAPTAAANATDLSDVSSDDFSADSEDDDDDDAEDGGGEVHDSEADESDAASMQSVSEVDEGSKESRFHVREIVFFTEKVEIFKVRHATL